MNIVPLTNEEQIRTDCQLKVVLRHTDFLGQGAATSYALPCFALPAGTIVSKTAVNIVSIFSNVTIGVAASGLAISAGQTSGSALAVASNSPTTAGLLLVTAPLTMAVNTAGNFTFTVATTAALSTLIGGEIHLFIQLFNVNNYAT